MVRNTGSLLESDKCFHLYIRAVEYRERENATPRIKDFIERILKHITLLLALIPINVLDNSDGFPLGEVTYTDTVLIPMKENCFSFSRCKAYRFQEQRSRVPSIECQSAGSSAERHLDLCSNRVEPRGQIQNHMLDSQLSVPSG